MALNIKRARKVVAFYEDRAIGAQVIAAEKALADAKASAGDRLASKVVREAEKALADVHEAARATVLDVTLQALPRKEWAEAEESNPPRKDNSVDSTFNVNVDTILHAVWPVSVVEVRDSAGELRTDITADDWRDAIDVIDDGQHSVMFLAINDLNRGSANPF